MTSFTARFAGIATLALAALPITALATAATAAPVAIKVQDIDLNTVSGQATFQQRADHAAQAFCRAESRPGSRHPAGAACVDGVKTEIAEKFALAQASQGSQRGHVAAR